MSEQDAESTEATSTQGSAENVEGDQVVVNEASPSESEAPAEGGESEADPSHESE